MESKVIINQLNQISVECQKCKGKHWDPNSQKKTQANVREEFGFIPNNCVNGNTGTVYCPSALGLFD